MARKKRLGQARAGVETELERGDAEKAATLRPGDFVRVRPGVCDPDFPDHEIGGWTGTISAVEDEDDDGDTICTVKWDRKTRNAMSAELKSRCKDQGIVLTEMDLDVADLDYAAAPDQPGPDSLDELLQEIENEGFWPPPDLVESIIAKGSPAIEPLREIVRRACIDPEDTACADIAAGILGDLRAHDAMPDLLRYLREGPPDAMDWVVGALVALADPTLRSSLGTIIRDQDLDPLRRTIAIDIYERVAQTQPEARVALVTLQTGLLTDLTARADKLSSPEHEFAGNIALTLGQMGVTEARPLIDAAFKNNTIPPWFASRNDVEENVKSASSRTPATRRTFLEEYRERYEEEEENVESDDQSADDSDDEGEDPFSSDENSDDDQSEELELDESLSTMPVAELLERMRAEGEWPSPAILHAILKKGAEAVEPLCEIVRRGAIAPDASDYVDTALGLLGDLKAVAAIPDILQLFRTGDEAGLSWAINALRAIGDVPVATVESLVRDQSLSPGRRGMAIDASMDIVRRDPGARAAMVPLLSELLDDLTRRAQRLTEAEQGFAASIVRAVAEAASHEARPLIAAAFAANAIDQDWVTPEDVEEIYSNAEPRDEGEQPARSYLRFYRSRYEEAMNRRKRIAEHRALESRARDRQPPVPSPRAARTSASVPMTATKVGRNDPCPCGSGKKYKKCCLGKGTAPAPTAPAVRQAPTPPSKPVTVATVKDALVSALATRIRGAPESNGSTVASPEASEPSAGLNHDDAPTIDYYEGHRLDDPGGREGLVEALVHDLEEGYFHTWHAVVCQERGLKLSKAQKRRLEDLIDFNDEPSERILYINEIPRPRQAWYEIVRDLTSRLLIEPLDVSKGFYRTMTEAWADLVSALEEHGRGLPLPEGVERPVDVVPADLQHRLWVQWCLDPVAGLGYHGQTLGNEKDHWRIEELVDRLRECKDSVAALSLTAETLLAKIVMPENERELAGRLLMEALKLDSVSKSLAVRL